MSRYLPYRPDQGYLVPPRVDEVLEADHLCFFVHRVVERLDLRGFEEPYSAAGGMLYHPSLMLKVWLYAYALGVTPSLLIGTNVQPRRQQGLKSYFPTGIFKKSRTPNADRVNRVE